ncbi:MAG: S46 family peptidase [Flavobacteriia bacterium]|nr:S46 family peptidase [Flavobacteriia bacterium]
MSNHKLSSILFLFLVNINVVLAEEGMLIPSLLAAFESDMKAKGMRLSADEIYSVNHSSLKDAIFQFGGGCTAELVSGKGLLLTNHHCGYSQIQSHSSLENDYIRNGYWAQNLTEELKNPGLTASRIVRIEDVTNAIFLGSSSKSDKATIEANMKKIAADAVAGTHYVAEVKAFDYGNAYYLMVKEEFLDVRFVGTPPNSIGKFGGDTDNWVWPRHTGDFSVFRIYAGPNNRPAAFSESNVPYTPLHYLPISMKERHVGDFTMVYGFPGTTEQHVVSSYLKFIIEKERPARIHMRDLSLGVIDKGMRSDDLIRIQYAAKQASIANAWKKWIGQIEGLKNLDGVGIKMQREKEYTDRASSNPEWLAKYGAVVQKMNDLVGKESDFEFKYAMGVEYLSVGPEYFKLVRALNDLITNYKKYADNGELAGVLEKLTKTGEGFFKNFNAQIDRQIFNLLTKEYIKYFTVKDESTIGLEVDQLTKIIYEKSIFTNQKRFNAFISNFNANSLKKLEKDAGFSHYSNHMSEFRNKIIPGYTNFSASMTALLQVYVEGRKIMYPEIKHWPDANSTLRITYGQLEGSSPTDGMMYTEHTTLDGIIAKYNSGNPDFELLPRMLDLHKEKNYGEYAQDGELWVCFTGSNHTTGGNSGSPVIDADGNLMGLNFDRTWESTMSDYMFDAARCRNVVVDIRYVLWVIDRYSNAKYLVDEMTIIRQ